MRKRCPTCGRSTKNLSQDNERFLPFCSERCQLIDLGRWFNQEYRISVEVPADGVPRPPDSDNGASSPSSHGP
jgi:endogenous inhibitor of DNA gyrase (YacG/DUF329 family)